jgi:hypothetical protein
MKHLSQLKKLDENAREATKCFWTFVLSPVWQRVRQDPRVNRQHAVTIPLLRI